MSFNCNRFFKTASKSVILKLGCPEALNHTKSGSIVFTKCNFEQLNVPMTMKLAYVYYC